MAYLGNTVQTAFTSFDKQDLTGSSGTGPFTLTHAVANENELQVFISNVRQEPTEAYTCSGNQITLTGAVSASDDFYVLFSGKALQTASHPSYLPLAATTGTFSGDLTVDTNTLYVNTTNNLVGIGTVNPTLDFSLAGLSVNASGTALQINNIDGASLRLTDPAEGGNRGLGITIQGTEAAISNCESGSLRFGTGNAERMTIDSSGRVTMPYQPVFGVYRTTTAASHTDVTHPNSWANVGSHYNSSNGRFTCPVAGTYFFYATGLTQPTGGTSRWFMRVNGGAYRMTSESRNQGGTAGAYLHGVTLGIATLALNDYVTMYYYNDDTTTTLYSDSTPFITFGGFLVG
jgi:hypothetical protein